MQTLLTISNLTRTANDCIGNGAFWSNDERSIVNMGSEIKDIIDW
jgi:hypothetical protein